MFNYIVQYYNEDRGPEDQQFIVSSILNISENNVLLNKMNVDMGNIIFSSPELIDKSARTTSIYKNKVEIGKRTSLSECYKFILYQIFKDEKRKEVEKV